MSALTSSNQVRALIPGPQMALPARATYEDETHDHVASGAHFDPANHSAYTNLASREIAGRMFNAGWSTDTSDPQWDDFLQSATLGQFQQSSIWAHVKKTEGFKSIRVIVTVDDRIAGGFQILWRRFSLWRIGYVSKGPVVWPEDPRVCEFVADLLRSVVEANKLSALIVQPPDLTEAIPATLPKNLFLPNVLKSVIESTLVVDVTGSLETIQQRISKYTRKKLRQADRRGAVIREGGKQDIGAFFQLMLATCKRQGEKASPRTEESLHALWDAGRATQNVRFIFAECGGKTVAGGLFIRFGGTVSFWKKGWNSTAGECRPNELITYEGLEWAKACDLKLLDFMGLDEATAQAMIKGEELTDEQKAGRDFLNICFGGQPRLLPRASVYFPSPVLRFAYKTVALGIFSKIGWFRSDHQKRRRRTPPHLAEQP